MKSQSPERQVREALIDSLEVGDLIRLNNLARVVRGVTKKGGRTTHIVLSIQRVTWTRRPYTVINRTDLYHRSLEIVKRGYGIGRTELEDKLRQEIENHNRRLMFASDVVGRIF